MPAQPPPGRQPRSDVPALFAAAPASSPPVFVTFRAILRGDVSQWPLLEAHQQMVLEQWRNESERLVKEARLKLVRRRAEAAFHARNYLEAEHLYASIRDDLTDEEPAEAPPAE